MAYSKILPNEGKLTERPKTLQDYMGQNAAPHSDKSGSLGAHMGQQSPPKQEKHCTHLNELMGQ